MNSSTPIELVKCKMQVQMMNMSPQQLRAAYRLLSPSSSPTRLFTFPSFTLSRIPATKSGTSHRTLYHAQPSTTSFKLPPGPIGTLRDTVREHGLRGLWIGQSGTLVRETGSTVAWFAVKEIVADFLLQRRQSENAYVLQDRPNRPAHIELEGPGMDLLPWESAMAGAIAGAAAVVAFYPADTVKSAMQTEDELRPSGLLKPGRASTFTETLRRMYTAHGLRGLYAGCGMTVARAVPSSGIVFVVYDGLATWLG